LLPHKGNMELKIYLQLLFNNWRIILVSVVVTFVGTLVFTRLQTPVYSASVTYIVSPSSSILEGTGFISGLSVLGGQPTIVNTYANIAASSTVKQNASEALGLSMAQTNSLAVDSRVLSGTNIIEISVQGADPMLVVLFANKIGEKTLAYVNELYDVYDMKILDGAKSPDRPVRPNMTLNLALGLAFGLALGGGLALVWGLREYY
jgi:capsular polysaccharide biosynthesis protein